MKPTRYFATLYCLILGTGSMIGCNSSQKPDAPPQVPPKARPAWWQDTSGMTPGAFPEQVVATLTSTANDAVWEPNVPSGRSRGASSIAVYQKVAPATVVVRCGGGHGTGFLIDKDGWIVTNHHVIAGAAPDPDSGASTAIVHLGRLEDGWMKLIDDSVPAIVYKANFQADLALLKLSRMPHGLDSLPVVKIASKSLNAGGDCFAIGHPQAGMLWTFRHGEVANDGVWPQDRIEIALNIVSAPDDERKRWAAIISHAQRKVTISSCGLNPGDSGGPLVNEQGELVAVSFAIPASDGSGVNLDKFSYHIHLDEVKDFLKQRPSTPDILRPQPWPPGRYHKPVDLEGKGKEDGIVFSVSPDGQATGMVVDLHEDSGLVGTLKQLFQSDAPRPPKVSFAWHRVPYPRTFYDTDGDGEIDLILTDTNYDGKAESALRLVNGKWQAEAANGRKLVDGSYFTNKNFAKRFAALKLDQIKQ
ncbi:MAG: serine protease [Thermoguttaceae bacterium]